MKKPIKPMKHPIDGSRTDGANLYVPSMLVAGGLSAAWLVLCSYYTGVNIGWQEVWRLPPQEIGAFYAGIFAPLAFMWLVAAYARRQKELTRT